MQAINLFLGPISEKKYSKARNNTDFYFDGAGRN